MDKGFKQVAALRGGKYAWKNAGLPVATGAPAAK